MMGLLTIEQKQRAWDMFHSMEQPYSPTGNRRSKHSNGGGLVHLSDGLHTADTFEMTGVPEIDSEVGKAIVVGKFIDRHIIFTRTEAERILNDR